MHPLRSALFGLLVGACAYGCAHGVDDLLTDVPGVDGGGTSISTGTPDANANGYGSADASANGDPDANGSADANGNVDANGNADADSDAAAVADAASDAAALPDASPHLDAGADSGALASGLGLPDPHGKSCKDIGGVSDCPFEKVCRIATPNGGRCDSFGTSAYGDPCGSSSECDDFNQCFNGTCTFMCRLGSHDCGKPSDCLDVGNATWGVCKT